MTDETKILERLGARVADDLGEGPSAERLAVQRRAFVAAAQMIVIPAPGRRSWLAPALAAAAVALLAIGAALLFPRGATPLPFWVGDGARRIAGTEGSWVQADGGESVPIRFRNGSNLELAGDTALRVVRADTERVSVEMTRGELAADVRRGDGTEWEVNAGPYTVAVLGTAFTVDWDAGRSHLAVAVTRGVVHVRGGQLGEYGIRLAAGKRLVTGERGERVAVGLIDDIGTVPEPAAAAADGARAIPGNGTAAELASASGTPAASSAAPDRAQKGAGGARPAAPLGGWKAAYAKRDYAAAVAAAEAEGIDALVGRLDIEDLWDLANASRLAHHGDITRRSFLAVRARFAGTPRAATAAFLLGRNELDEGGSAEIARGWFETYLREASAGPFAEESLGRLIEACDKSGSKEDARRYAERYLSRYQDGLFAVLAESILSR
jgi:hypothetical protein